MKVKNSVRIIQYHCCLILALFVFVKFKKNVIAYPGKYGYD